MSRPLVISHHLYVLLKNKEKKMQVFQKQARLWQTMHNLLFLVIHFIPTKEEIVLWILIMIQTGQYFNQLSFDSCKVFFLILLIQKKTPKIYMCLVCKFPGLLWLNILLQKPFCVHFEWNILWKLCDLQESHDLMSHEQSGRA